VYFLKNNSGNHDTWSGTYIANSTYRLIEAGQEIRFSTNDDVVVDVGNGNLIVATVDDGTGDLTPAQGLAMLLGYSPTPVKLDPFTTSGEYSFKGVGFSSSCAAGQSTEIDEVLPEARRVDKISIWFPEDVAGVTATCEVVIGGQVVDNYTEKPWNLQGGNHMNLITPGYAADLPANTTFRLTVNTASNITIYGNLYLHKKDA
jgi:hypothetical protein